MATSTNSQDGDHGFQIAPMVDVVFVLLLFFMALAGATQVEKYLTVPLPGPGDGDPPIVLDIAADGAVSANGLNLVAAGDLEVTALHAWLRKIADVESGTPFIIRPNNDATHERFIQVLSALRQLGIRKVSFA